jgi:hypothetical protein
VIIPQTPVRSTSGDNALKPYRLWKNTIISFGGVGEAALITAHGREHQLEQDHQRRPEQEILPGMVVCTGKSLP